MVAPLALGASMGQVDLPVICWQNVEVVLKILHLLP